MCVGFMCCSASVNVLVPNCKIYNDASCDISADGQLLAVFIPSSQRGFPDEGILAIYSLAPHNLGEMLYTKRFGTVSSRRADVYFTLNLAWSSPFNLMWIRFAFQFSQSDNWIIQLNVYNEPNHAEMAKYKTKMKNLNLHKYILINPEQISIQVLFLVGKNSNAWFPTVTTKAIKI